MALLLGIDTGGTFTDAVLVEDLPAGGGRAVVLAAAKAPTTHHDLAVGVAEALDAVLAHGHQALDADQREIAQSISLVSVSTTLATNALVEGHGEPAGLVTFGFTPTELERSGISTAVPADLLVTLDGGHDAHGNERAPLDLEQIELQVKGLAPVVSAFAVAAQFSVRNPTHERTAAELIRTVTSLPVTASHELSAKLDGPRRALTAALNARLLGTIDRLNQAVASVMAANEIGAPLMVVRGDGSLVSADFAGARPIETILSGPAASVIGALHLADLDDGLVADIGGTTTDVAVITQGQPAIAERGARVGGHQTMVEAVEMATIGLGGDSEVTVDTRHSDGPVLLGPERAIPIGRLAVQCPEIHHALDMQLGAPMGLTDHGRFLVATAPPNVQIDDAREQLVLDRVMAGPLPVNEAARTGLEQQAVRRLRARGLVRIATMTPTDAVAVLIGAGNLDSDIGEIDMDASAKVASCLARQTNESGGTLAEGGVALAATVVEILQKRSAQFAVRTALEADGIDPAGGDTLLQASLAKHARAATVQIALSAPLTVIGAPAVTYYPAVAAAAGTTVVIPPHAGVANAVGAVVGQVRVRAAATITQPTRGQYRVHLEDQPTFGSVENARAKATELLSAQALADAESAGASNPKITESWSERVAHVNGKDIFVEGVLTIEASGRPSLR